ncbi:pheromone processing endoprotease, partial [Blyttiomyces sp. JEL0837]
MHEEHEYDEPPLLLHPLLLHGPSIPKNDHANFDYFAVKVGGVNDIDDNTNNNININNLLQQQQQQQQQVGQSLSITTTSHESTLHTIKSETPLILIDQIGSLQNWYLFARSKSKSNQQDEDHHRLLPRDSTDASILTLIDGVESANLQVPEKRLFKRGWIDSDLDSSSKKHDSSFSSGLLMERDRGGKKKRGMFDLTKAVPWVNSTVEQGTKRLKIQDPGFVNQWHLFNREQKGNDINVTGLWELGITGKGVTVCLIDDGIDIDHPDIKDSFFAEGSYDFNDHVDLPRPQKPNEDRHGTRCAGQIVAARNDVCGIGVAWDAKVSGIRILSGVLTHADEASAINYAMDKNHIYSCSWGPSDDGMSLYGPPPIVKEAFKNGIDNGRGGLGSIFVFATGNGGEEHDNCNFDGYSNSIYTISIGAIDRLNQHPLYSEQCSAQLAVTYSSNDNDYIYTSDWPDQCANNHGRTSAAAPLASGMFSLALSVRPDLTWRDFQYIVLRSAVVVNEDDVSWKKLPSGRFFSHKFGYGRLDGVNLVRVAQEFKKVGVQTFFETEWVVLGNSSSSVGSNGLNDRDEGGDSDNGILQGNEIPKMEGDTEEDAPYFASVIDIVDDAKSKGSKSGISKLARLEHVTVTVSISHPKRGDLEVDLVSPNNVVSHLATRRPKDN